MEKYSQNLLLYFKSLDLVRTLKSRGLSDHFNNAEKQRRGLLLWTPPPSSGLMGYCCHVALKQL